MLFFQFCRYYLGFFLTFLTNFFLSFLHLTIIKSLLLFLSICKWKNEGVWVELKLAFHLYVFTPFFFSFFFSLHVNSKSTMQETKNTIHVLFIYCSRTIHEPHDTIHTFKNYFATVFSVFSFQFSVSAIISSIQTDS